MSSPTHHHQNAFWNRQEFKIIIGYLVGSWTLLEFLNFSLERLAIAPVWAEIFLYAVLMFIPSLLILTFVSPESRRFLRIARKIFPYVNGTIILLVLIFSFWGSELGAMTKEVSYTNDSGEEVSKTVLKGDFIKRVIAPTFEYSGENPEEYLASDSAWVGRGIVSSLAQNLRQHQFVQLDWYTADTPLKEILYTLRTYSDYLLTGSYQWSNGQIVASIALSNKKNKVFHTAELSASSVFELSNQLKMMLLEKLELYYDKEQLTDLPFEEFVTDNEEAFREWIDGDYISAIKIDPNFAYAYSSELAKINAYGLGDLYMSEMALKALKIAGRLPDRDQLFIRAMYFVSLGEMKKAQQVYSNFVKLNPGDKLALYDYVFFLTINGFYDHALELAVKEVSKKFDTYMAILAYDLLRMKNEPDVIESHLKKFKLFLEDAQYSMVKGELGFMRENYDQAINLFENTLLSKPLYYTMDSLIKISKFHQNTSADKINKWSQEMVGKYFIESSDQTFLIKYENKRLSAHYGGQLPEVGYMMDRNQFYFCRPYWNDQFQIKKKFLTGKHGQIFKVRATQQNHTDQESFDYYSFKDDGSVLKGIAAFKAGDYPLADSLLQVTWAYDTGYYFVKNFLKAIDASEFKSTRGIYSSINGKAFENEESDFLSFEMKGSQLLILVPEGGVRRVYHMGDNWMLNSFRKNILYRLVEDDSLKLETYRFNHETSSYEYYNTLVEKLNKP